MTQLLQCTHCQRHVRISEVSCPFCEHPVVAQPGRPAPPQRMGRAALLAFGAALLSGSVAAPGCESSTVTSDATTSGSNASSSASSGSGGHGGQGGNDGGGGSFNATGGGGVGGEAGTGGQGGEGGTGIAPPYGHAPLGATPAQT